MKPRRARGAIAWRNPGRRELAWLLLLLLPAGGLLAFLEIAEEVGEGEIERFDAALLLALRTPGDPADPLGPRWVEIMFRDLTSLGSHAVLAVVAVVAVGFLLASGKRAAALLMAVSVGGGALLSAGLKSLYQRPRPDLVTHLAEVSSASFPSGHAMLSAVTYLTLGALLARVQPQQRLKAYIFSVALALTIVVGLSRVYLGVHWPTDVLAGWVVGAAWAILCWLLATWLQRRGRIEGAAGAGAGAAH